MPLAFEMRRLNVFLSIIYRENHNLRKNGSINKCVYDVQESLDGPISCEMA
jgi:hypothetical protein